MFGLLRVIDGPDKGRMFTLVEGQTLVVGCGPDTDTRLRDPSAAANHCEMRLANGRVYLRDAGSATGTHVNQERVTEHELLPGDIVHVGNTALAFQWTRIDEGSTRQDMRALDD